MSCNGERLCVDCVHLGRNAKDAPCNKCLGTENKPNFRLKQVYISTADNRKNDLLDAARYAVICKDGMDVNSLYPTLKYTPINVDPKELELVMEKVTQWPIHRPLNPLYGITQYIDKDVKITTELLKRMEAETEKNMREPKKVIFNDPATIVFWHDGTKTIVKAIDEPFDPEKGLAMAIAKKHLGNKHEYYNVFKKYLKKYEKEQVKEVFANIDEVHETKEYSENAVPMPTCYGNAIGVTSDICNECLFKPGCEQAVSFILNAGELNKE